MTTRKIGPTGDYPEGKLNEADEGGLRVAIGVHDNRIILQFGKQVSWLGMDPENAQSMGEKLIQMAQTIRDYGKKNSKEGHGDDTRPGDQRNRGSDKQPPKG